MKQENTYKSFDKEVKIVLLKALKKGFFEQSDIDVLETKGCIKKDDDELGFEDLPQEELTALIMKMQNNEALKRIEAKTNNNSFE